MMDNNIVEGSTITEKKIAKIITIDAAAKLEGERTGTIAEGVGVALGGIGVDRTYIENVAVKRKIPLDSISTTVGAGSIWSARCWRLPARSACASKGAA